MLTFAQAFIQPQMFFGPGQQPAFLPAAARGQIPYPQAMPGMQAGRGGFPGGLPPQQAGRGMPVGAAQIPAAMFGLPTNLPPGSFPPGAYGNPAYLQHIAQAAAAQQASLAGRIPAGGRGHMGGMPGVPLGVPPMNAMRGSAANQGLGRSSLPSRPGQNVLPPNRGMAPQMAPQMAPVHPGGSGIDIFTLSAAPPAQQKQLLGEALYPKIHEQQPDLAGKITGMLLEMENQELLNL